MNVYTHFDSIFPNGDQAQSVCFLYEVKALGECDVLAICNEETLALRFFTPSDIEQLELASEQYHLMIVEYLSNTFAMGH